MNNSFELIYFHENVSPDPSCFVLHYCSGQIEYYSFEIHSWSWSLCWIFCSSISTCSVDPVLTILVVSIFCSYLSFTVLVFRCIIYVNSDVKLHELLLYFKFSAVRYYIALYLCQWYVILWFILFTSEANDNLLFWTIRVDMFCRFGTVKMAGRYIWYQSFGFSKL